MQNNAATVATPPVSPTGIPHVASIQSVQVNAGTSNRVDPNAIIQYSALSIKSIQTKKQLEAQLASQQPNAEENLPETPFTETDLRLCWNQYADRLGSQGQKILESLLRMSQPSLHMNFKIVYELPNEGSRLDFESGKYEFVQFLRTKLNNFKLDIEVIVNESFETRRAYTPQEKYQRLVELNPAIEQLRQTFDLNF